VGVYGRERRGGVGDRMLEGVYLGREEGECRLRAWWVRILGTEMNPG
jgi:hypothetical protein